jgi:endoglucanase
MYNFSPIVMKKLPIIVVFFLFCCFLFLPVLDLVAQQFEIQRGVNISHWLSQSQRRGEERINFFTEDDVAFIKSIGYDHIRIPIDEEQMWDEDGNKELEAFNLLHQALNWCDQHDLRAIVDLHILRSHHFNQEERPLWTDPKEQEKFVNLWKHLSSELSKYSTEKVAYELMNEAVADDPEDWNNLIAKAVESIRTTEPKRFIVVGSNMWQKTETFDQLRVPENDRYIILSFHLYEPMLITHHQASWTAVRKYDGPVQYPGKPIKEEDLEKLSPEVREIVENSNEYFDQSVLEKKLEKPLDLAEKHNLQLYCGEWGVYKATPEEVALKWYEDVRQLFDKYNIAWANWDYKGSFGIIKDGEKDQNLINVLLTREND